MENKTNHESVADSPNEGEKHVTPDETSENKEEACEKEIGMSERNDPNTHDTSAGEEEHVARESMYIPACEEQLCDTPCTPVERISSASNSDRCPIPPTRARRKSRTNSDTAKSGEEEKSNGNRGETEGQAEEEKVLGGKEESESENKEEKEESGEEEDCDDQVKVDKEEDGREEESVTQEEKEKEEDEQKKNREEADLIKDVSEENGKVSSEKEENHLQKMLTDTHEENKPTPTRRSRKKDTTTNNSLTKPKKEEKKLNLEEGKIELKENEKVKKMEEEEGEKRSLVGMKKELGLVNCVGIIVGNIIGTGIFISPGAVLQYTGSIGMSLIIWVVSGLATIVGALIYSELGGSTLPLRLGHMWLLLVAWKHYIVLGFAQPLW